MPARVHTLAWETRPTAHMDETWPVCAKSKAVLGEVRRSGATRHRAQHGLGPSLAGAAHVSEPVDYLRAWQVDAYLSACVTAP